MQVEDPNMIDSEKQAAEQEPEQNDIAEEYMFDEQAQQTEGKLAADKVQEQAHQDDEDVPMMEDSKEELPTENQPDDIEMTRQMALN